MTKYRVNFCITYDVDAEDEAGAIKKADKKMRNNIVFLQRREDISMSTSVEEA